METLINFLKFSSALDWLVILLTLVLIVVALALLIFLRRSKPFYFVAASGLLPLSGGLLSTLLKYQYAQRALEVAGTGFSEVVERAHAEAWVITYIAAAGALMIALIGFLGVILKRPAVAK